MLSVYTPSYDGVPLDIVSHETDLAPRVAQHVPTLGRGAQLDARGRGARTDSLVVKTTGDDADQLDYRGWLQGLMQSDAARRFVHPFDGSWLARLSAFTERAAGGSFEFSMTLIEDVPQTIRADGNRGAAATLQALSVAAEVLEAATLALAAEAPASAGAVPSGAAVVAMLAEHSPTGSPQESAAGLDAWRQGAGTAQLQLRASTSRAAYQASVALAEFSGSLEQFSATAAAAGRALHMVTTQRAQPLIVLLTRLYDASTAQRLAGEVAALNSLVDILLVPVGTRLRLPRMA